MPRFHVLSNADLHCHSTVSDGTLAPEAVAARAAAQGVELWALTDHDEVSGIARARGAAQALGLPVAYFHATSDPLAKIILLVGRLSPKEQAKISDLVEKWVEKK